MEPILSVEHLRRDYGGRGSVTHAVDDVSFSVERGEFVGIMGASGSGKSTLLNCIATIDTPTAGHIRVEGQDVTALKGRSLSRFRRERLGFVFQDFLLLDGLTVMENILLPAIIGGAMSQKVQARAEQLCQVFGIGAIQNKYPAEISGGEKQRTAVARALINHPLLILADEPTGNLDSRSSRAVIRSFEQAKQMLGATIFMVTHDSFAASFCDRVILLRDGVVWRTLEKGGMERSAFQDHLLECIGRMSREEEP